MRVDLTTAAGFPVWLTEGELRFGEGVLVREIKPRRRGELEAVARDRATCVPPNAVQYWMYNDIVVRADVARIVTTLQYELTLLLPNPLGSEKAKTLGHIHNAPATGQASFAEAFEVLYGTAHFLVWTLDATKTRAPFCAVVECRAGECIALPPNLYHLTINADAEPLLFADLISKRARGIYEDVIQTRGAPLYELTNGEWVPNPAFTEVASLTTFEPPRLAAGVPLYAQWVNRPRAFDWLDDPSAFSGFFHCAGLAS